MQDTILKLVKDLMSIPSTKEHKEELSRVLEVATASLKDFTIEKFEKDGVPSALVYVGNQRPTPFKVILNAHLDVVPAKENQFTPVEKNGKLYGRGAIDMKAAAAVEILVFQELAKKLPFSLGLQLVTDEEIGGFLGTKYQVDKGIRAEFVIAGEPTNFGINNKAKGIIWAKVQTTGKVAHGAYLWNGENAIWKMKTFLDKLQQAFPIPEKETWVTTANLAKIETSNVTYNQVPEDCAAWLDIRYIPEDAGTIENTLKGLLPEGAEIEFIEKEPYHLISEKNPYFLLLSKAIQQTTGEKVELIQKHGGSDVRHYQSVNSPSVVFGPVGVGLHADEEWVEIQSLETYYTILKTFLLSL